MTSRTLQHPSEKTGEHLAQFNQRARRVLHVPAISKSLEWEHHFSNCPNIRNPMPASVPIQSLCWWKIHTTINQFSLMRSICPGLRKEKGKKTMYKHVQHAYNFRWWRFRNLSMNQKKTNMGLTSVNMVLLYQGAWISASIVVWDKVQSKRFRPWQTSFLTKQNIFCTAWGL